MKLRPFSTGGAPTQCKHWEIQTCQRIHKFKQVIIFLFNTVETRLERIIHISPISL